MGVGEQDLLRPAVIGAAGVDFVAAHLEIAAPAVAADRHLRVSHAEAVAAADLMVHLARQRAAPGS